MSKPSDIISAYLSPESFKWLQSNQPRVLSNRTHITFKYGDKEINLGELDGFKATARDSVTIRKPAGYTHEIVTKYNPGGYDIEFNGGKVNWQLMRYMIRQQNLAAFENPTDNNFSDNVLFARNTAPKISIFEKVRHFDGSEEFYQYIDVTLFNFMHDVPNDMQELKESVKGFATKCVPVNGSYKVSDENGDLTSSKNLVDFMIDDMMSKTEEAHTFVRNDNTEFIA